MTVLEGNEPDGFKTVELEKLYITIVIINEWIYQSSYLKTPHNIGSMTKFLHECSFFHI